MDFSDTNRMAVCLSKMGELLDQFEAFTRAVENEIAQRKMQQVQQTELAVETPTENVPESVQLLFEALIARVPERPTAYRITTPFQGWETEINACDVAKWRGIPRHTTEEVKFALQRYSHPRVQWARPGNVQLCRIRDAA
jgi:hypothetical protein